LASPAVRSSVVTAGSAAALNPVVNLPATIEAGDTLLVVIRSTGTASFTWPAGWTELLESAADASDDAFSVGWRLADGTEDSGTVTINTNVTERFAALAWAISGATDPTSTPPTISTVVSASTLTPNPPSLNTGVSKDYLWFSIASSEGENTFSSYSTNYGLGQINTNTGTAGAVANNCRIAGSARQLTAQTEDPGVITWTGTADDTMAITIAVHPTQLQGYRDAVFRIKTRADAWNDAVARIRSSVLAYRDAVVRIAVVLPISDVYRDAGARSRLRLSQSASPNLDFFNDGWTTHLGGSSQLYQRIDELARDDADYIRSVLDPGDDLVVFTMSALQDPGDNNGLRMRFVTGKSAAGGTTINLVVQLRTVVGGITATRTFNDLSADLTEVSILWTSAEVDTFRANDGFAQPLVGFRVTSS
jgi:hypothetical protein